MGTDAVSDRGGRKAHLLRAAAVLCLAALPRLIDLGGHSLTADEPLWVLRGTDYVKQVGKGKFERATRHYQEHPGITAGILVGSGCVIKRRLAGDDWGFLNIESNLGNMEKALSEISTFLGEVKRAI